MHRFLTHLILAGNLGLALSVGGVIYSTGNYLYLSRNAKQIEDIAPGRDVVVEKLQVVLAEHKDRSLIIGELQARHNQNTIIYDVLSKIVTGSQTHALRMSVLWILSGAVFALLMIVIHRIRRQVGRESGDAGT